MRFTKYVAGIEQISYEESLEKLGLFFLEHRKLKGDMLRNITL